MKIRMRGDSLRLRLQQTEVRRFRDVGHVTESVSFGSSRLRYTLTQSSIVEVPTADFKDNEILIQLPCRVAETWINTDQVSVLHDQIRDGFTLKILVEKDFMCLKPRTSMAWEDESDAFPNPNPSCGHTA